ncbi:hypothetical protein ETD86_46580 [Nonomuraea turkmeniaca]|uniref:Uncharacterized protein n=1 Tax=Nonomuraea turkmeniaca TaxID=103838 RepID=A0A5S4EYU2_9ACTN|nr:hypothetical protein [Nonomuraea turkmeniaca]TMR08719.1 hypothetical protein ETD86_46580 [Nonomuraea turkmeniaca]
MTSSRRTGRSRILWAPPGTPLSDEAAWCGLGIADDARIEYWPVDAGAEPPVRKWLPAIMTTWVLHGGVCVVRCLEDERPRPERRRVNVMYRRRVLRRMRRRRRA